MKLNTICFILIVLGLIAALSGKDTNAQIPLQKNNGKKSGGFNPAEWHFESQRDEIAPVHSLNFDVVYKNKPTLTLSGGGKKYANGCWKTTRDVIPEMYYRFKVFYKARHVEEPGRSVLAGIIWVDENNKQIGTTEYPRTLLHETTDGWNIIEQVFRVPPLARSAQLKLIYRWDADGTVHFGDFSFVETNEPPARMVRLATVFHRPKNSKNSQENLNQFAKLVGVASIHGADAVCLPEAITLVGTKHNYVSVAEPVPGPTTRFLGETAKKNNLYIIAGILEKDEDVIYNTAILIDRKGELAGKYRKVSLPREEIDGGVTPGDSIPVFDTDFGRIGMMICWDVHFPEVARTLALRGAEVIFMPIWGGNITLAQARAIENQVYLVSSGYDMKSAIFDMTGQIMEEATVNNPVAISEIDLNEQILWPWLGNLRNRIFREIPSVNTMVKEK